MYNKKKPASTDKADVFWGVMFIIGLTAIVVSGLTFIAGTLLSVLTTEVYDFSKPVYMSYGGLLICICSLILFQGEEASNVEKTSRQTEHRKTDFHT